jgi:hypothetical protein
MTFDGRDRADAAAARGGPRRSAASNGPPTSTMAVAELPMDRELRAWLIGRTGGTRSAKPREPLQGRGRFVAPG